MSNIRTSELTDDEMAETIESVRFFQEVMPRFVQPIYKVSSDGRPDLVGSGFILEAHDRCFFVTAAHVFDHHSSNSPLFYFVGQSRRQLIDGPFEVSKSNQLNRSDDRVDVAVIALSSQDARPTAEIEKCTISLKQVDANASNIADCRFVVSGYPLSKHKPDHDSKLLNPRCHVWIGNAVPSTSYERLGISRTENILIQFAQRGVLGSEGNTGGTFPAPRGLSGAPVWRTVGRRNQRGLLIVESFLLVGVLIEYKKAEKSLMATNINSVLDMVEVLVKRLPSLNK